MSPTVAHMSRDEIQDLMEAVVEQKLVALLGDPEEGLPLKKTLHDRLVRQNGGRCRR